MSSFITYNVTIAIAFVRVGVRFLIFNDISLPMNHKHYKIAGEMTRMKIKITILEIDSGNRIYKKQSILSNIVAVDFFPFPSKVILADSRSFDSKLTQNSSVKTFNQIYLHFEVGQIDM